MLDQMVKSMNNQINHLVKNKKEFVFGTGSNSGGSGSDKTLVNEVFEGIKQRIRDQEMVESKLQHGIMGKLKKNTEKITSQ